MNDPVELDPQVPAWVMWCLHAFFLVLFFPALAVTVPAHIYLHCNGYLK